MSDTIDSNSQAPLPNVWRTVLSTTLLLFWLLFMLCLHMVWRLVAPKKLSQFFILFHKGCCSIFAIRCEIKGQLSTARPTLFLSNHISYLDVFVLGSVLPGHFIAKSEVAGWPVLGQLARVQNTLFFERKGSKIRGQLGVMSEHFNQKGNLILFPEGTSTEGEHVEPFKPSLLQSIEGATLPVVIQPVTVAYTHYDNKPMDRHTRDYYAWYADMAFAPHFFSALGLGRSKVQIILHPPVALDDFETRKDCASHCWQQVSTGLEHALSDQL